MAVRGQAYVSMHPWLMDTPVSNGQLVNIGHTFLGLLGVTEVAVELLDGIPDALLSNLSSARTQLSDALAASPVLAGSLLCALDEAADAVDRLLDWMCEAESAEVVKAVYELRLQRSADMHFSVSEFVYACGGGA